MHLVRYEDLSFDPYSVLDDLFEFLDLPRSAAIDRYIETHTHRKRAKKHKGKAMPKSKVMENPYSKYRDSKATAVAWRKKMDFGYMRRIQEKCAAPMRTAGYRTFASQAERDDESLGVLTKDRKVVWPIDADAAENIVTT